MNRVLFTFIDGEVSFISTFSFCLMLLIVLLSLTYAIVRYLRFRKPIRQMLQKELKRVRPELAYWEHHPGRQLEILQPIFNAVSFSMRRKLKTDSKRIDDLIDRELNRLIKSPWSRFVSSFELFLMMTIAWVLAGASSLVVLLVITTYRDDSLRLNNTALNEWLETSDGKEINPPSILSNTTTGVTSNSTVYKLPKQITSSKELGQALAYHISRHDTRFVIRHLGNTSRFDQTIDDAWKWLAQNEPYLMRISGGGDGRYKDLGYAVDYELTMNYEISAKQAQRVQEKVKQIAQQMPDNWSDYQKVRYVNEYIVRHTAYQLKTTESPYTPYSILFNQEGVCEGYALTAYLLLQAADVEIRYISGKAGGGLHAWNMVKLENQWYHLDTTWNDPLPDRPNEVRENYLLVSDATLRKDHTWNTGKYPQTARQDY